MKNLLNKVLTALIISYSCIWSVSMGYTQSATQLPPATPTFFDNNGKPLASGTITFNAPSTTTPKTVWQDSGKVVPWSNPIVLNAAGRPPGDKGIYGDGTYTQIVKDKNGNVIWNQPTSSVGTGGGGSSSTVGDGDIVGVIKAWAGFVVPSQYLFAAGQAIVRATYPEAFAAITFNTPATCTIGSSNLVGISSTEQIPIGAPIESVCFNTGSTVTAKPTPTSLTISSNAIITATTTARVFPWGNGDGNTTFNLPDLRGRTIAGRNNMNNITASNLTTAFFGTPTPNSVGGYGGAESRTLTAAQSALPSHSHSVFAVDTGHTHTLSPVAYRQASGTGINFYTVSGPDGYVNLTTSPAQQIANGTANITIGPASGAGATGNVTATTTQANAAAAVSIVQPTATSNYIIKVTPDTNSNSFFGVASVGGMQGVLLCGIGITCAGNTISSAAGALPPPQPTVLGGIFSKTVVAGQVVTGLDTAGNLITGSVSGTGTVTNIATSGGITGGPITTTGTVSLAGITGNSVMANANAATTIPIGMAIPSCSTANSAVTWTTNIGFGCNTIAAGGTVNAAGSGMTLTVGGTTLGFVGIPANTVYTNATNGSAVPLPFVMPAACTSSTSALIWTNGVGFGCNTIATGGLSPIAADNLLGNPTGASAVPVGMPIGNCANALTYDTTTHTFGCNITAGTGTVTQVFAGAGLAVTPSIANQANYTLSMPDVITAAGPIGTTTTAPVITYDAKGRLTAVTTVAMAPPFSAVTGQTTLAQLPTLTANTVLANPSAISATPVAHAVPNCVTSAGFPNALNWTAGGGFSCGVVSINPSTFTTIAQYYAGTSTNTIISPSVIYPAEVSIAWGASIALDFSTFINSVITHTGSMTITATGVIAGKAGMIRFIQSGGGAFTVIWPTQFKWAAGSVKTLTGTTGAVDVLSYNCSTTAFCTVALLKDVQ